MARGGGDERDGLGEVGGLQRGDVVEQTLHQRACVGVGDMAWQLGIDHAGLDRGHADSAGAEFDAHQPGEMADVGLGARIDRELLQNAGGGDGGGVDQVGRAAGVGRRGELRQERGDDVHDPGDVEVDLPLPVLDPQLFDRRDQLYPGVVQDEVGGTEPVGDPGRGVGDRGALGDVDGDRQGGAAAFPDGGDEVVEPVLAAGQDGDGGAEFGQAQGGGGADAAGDDGDAASGVPVSRADMMILS